MSYDLPSRRLVSQEDASMVARPDVPRSKFSGSWTRLTTFDAGYLVPFLVDEILPGDHMRYDVSAYLRMSTPYFPVMGNQRVDTHFFFVPNRLVWANFQRFMGEQDSPSDSIAFTVPQIQSTGNGFVVGGLGDYFGLPTIGQPTGVLLVNALPFRMYNLIYNQWFRDENLQSSSSVPTNDATVVGEGNYPVRRRAKSHDPFTSALPWPQKFTAPQVSLSGFAPVFGIGGLGAPGGGVFPNEYGGFAGSYGNAWTAGTIGDVAVEASGSGATAWPLLLATLGDGAAWFDINSFRQAYLIQQMLERDARGGTRYTEIIRGHFGVVSQDMRLQRAEFLGGGSSPLNVTPVAQTAPVAGVGVGALGAAATSVGQHNASYAATEHGYIIGLISVKSELGYQQGIPKTFLRQTRYDYYWPSLAGLSEQVIQKQEIFAVGGGAAQDTEVFGYQERNWEYRQRVSEVTGVFRSTAAGTLDAWHFAQDFASVPVLGSTFIQDTPDMVRVLSAGSAANGQQYLADIEIRREATRPIPQYGTPVTLGRF